MSTDEVNLTLQRRATAAPVTPALARIVIDSAARGHFLQKENTIAAWLRANLQRPSWPTVAAVLFAVTLSVWWLTSRQQAPDVDPPALIANHYIERARTLLDSRRLAEAALALENARRVQPSNPNLPALDAQLRAALAGILVQAREAEARAQTRVDQPAMATSTPQAQARSVPTPISTGAPMSLRGEPVASSSASNGPGVRETAATLAVSSQLAQGLLDQAHVRAPQTTSDAPVAKLPEITAAAIPEAAPVATTQPLPPAEAPQRRLIKFVPPEYPGEASMRGYEGWVDVSLDVTAAGDVLNPRVEDSNRGRLFNRAALAAVKQWKYEPRTAAEPARNIRIRLEFKRPR